jgi:hypothetical protein
MWEFTYDEDVESLETHRGRKCGHNEAGILCQPQVHSKQRASNLCINTTASMLTVLGKQVVVFYPRPELTWSGHTIVGGSITH